MSEPAEAVRGVARRVGQTLGKYRVERVLGSGGMATVYLGLHRNGHRVALKVLSADLGADADIRARFVREGYAANSIDHPGVVRVIDDDVAEDGAPFLVMEFLDGETLNGRVARLGGTLPPKEVLALAHQLLDVLAVAHAGGTIHRDLKPDNLLLTREGTLKVLDFGIARLGTPLSGSDPTHTGRTMGTPAFMAPEQAFGRTREVDARTDLWSVGATMFTLLSGEHVHPADNATQALVMAATMPARALGSVMPGVPDGIAGVVDRACAFERGDRWPDARAMQAAVDEAYRAIAGEDIGGARLHGASSGETLASAPTLEAFSGAPSGPAARPDRPPARLAPGLRRALVAAALLSAVASASALLGRRGAPSTRATVDPPPLAGRCTSSATCGGLALCRKGACVPLDSADCTFEARPGDVQDDATVWIGAMFATRGTMAAEFDGALRDVSLGRRDFMEMTSGLPPARPGGRPRPLGVVLCDDSVAPERAARHLVTDLGIAGVIGFSRSKEVSDLATEIFNPSRTLALASNTASMLSVIPAPPGEPRMVWRTTVSSSMLVPALAALVGEVLEPAVRESGLGKDAPLRVALLNPDNATGVSNVDALVGSLRFNGSNAADNGDSFRQFLTVDGRTDREEAARLAAELLAFRPHVIVDEATNGQIVWALEPLWKEAIRPRYLVGAIQDSAEGRRLDDRAVGRVLDVDPDDHGSAATKLALRYAAVFDPRTTPTRSLAQGPYDAFYALAYAMVALGDAPATGPSLARALGRLRGGATKVDVGPGAIVEATAALGRGENIALQGAITSLDFDPRTGDPSVELTIECVRNGRDGIVGVPSGLRWDRQARRVLGALSCK